MKGSFQEALTEYQIAIRLVDDPYILGLIGCVYAISGKRDEALKTIDQMKEISRLRYLPAYSFAVIYAALGDKDQAFQWLEKTYQDRAPDLVFFSIDPLIDNLRSDPRFADFGRRAGLAELKK